MVDHCKTPTLQTADLLLIKHVAMHVDVAVMQRAEESPACRARRMSSVDAEYPTQTLRLTNVVSYVVLIAVNVASNSGILGPTNAEISQKYSTPLTPAG